MNFYRTVILFIFLCIVTPAIARFSASQRIRHSIEFFNDHNTLRIEGYLSFQANNGLLTTSYPNVLFRYGLIKILELRLGVQLSSINDLAKYTSKTGIAPIQPGLKIRLVKPKGFVPATAFTASFVIPHAATSQLRQTYWAPSLIFSAEQDITEKLSFEYALGMQWDPDNFQRGYFTTLNMEYDFTPESTVYADAYLLKPEQTQADIRVDIGVNRTITKNLQFDLSAGAGLTNAAPEFFFNIGFIFSYGDWKKLAMKKNSYTNRPAQHTAPPLYR
ncbi:MAG: hypothetical protein JWO03_3072 [Bacteroidetes bacterium]|nr:hypothetical protein [Bacteroidota bacterium]